MMKVRLIGLLILIFAVNGLAQKLPKGFEIKYDKFKDQSQVYFFDDYTGIALVNLTAGFNHPGTDLTENQKDFYLYFSGLNCSGFCFHDASFILLIDGERVSFPNDRSLSDSVIFAIDRSMLERMAAAKVVEFQVGRFEGTWKEKTIKKFKTLVDLGTMKK